MIERNRWIYDLIYRGECGCHVPVFHDLAPPERIGIEVNVIHSCIAGVFARRRAADDSNRCHVF